MNRPVLVALIAAPVLLLGTWATAAAVSQPGTPDLGGVVEVTAQQVSRSPDAPSAGPEVTSTVVDSGGDSPAVSSPDAAGETTQPAPTAPTTGTSDRSAASSTAPSTTSPPSSPRSTSTAPPTSSAGATPVIGGEAWPAGPDDDDDIDDDDNDDDDDDDDDYDDEDDD